ncbi:MAG: AAA family ATPase [Chloroflexota bacterium]
MSTRELLKAIIDSVESVIVGKRQAVEMAVVALLCEGHVLVEDVPGIGKTTLCKAIARSIGCSFRRIQLTPDVLPSDVTGLYFFNQRSADFEFRPGPVFANLVLADEINRATPRTQSALLECMEERQVTVDGETRPLPRPFLVIATQNPVELEGTFPLPEAQLDRFLLKIEMGYPTEAEESEMVTRFEETNPLDELQPVASAAQLLELQRKTRTIHVDQSIRDYIVQVTRATRSHSAVQLGGSPRATLALYRASQARALLDGRSYALPDDVKFMASPVLSHRLILDPQARLRGKKPSAVIDEVLRSTAVPVEGSYQPSDLVDCV